MPNREEIRDNIAMMLPSTWYASDFSDNTWETMADEVMEYLHSQGVVIKVDRELPLSYTLGILRPDGRPMVMARDKDVNEVQQDMLKAGYVAVTSLI